MSEQDLGTYEMLWNCPYCGTRKLLGLTHRHCPECGAEQDPTTRYFPSDEDKVLVKDHVYTGADRICPACKAPMGAKAKNCTACGSPLEGAKDAALCEDKPAVKPAKTPAKPAPPKKGKGCLVVGIVAGVVLVVLAVIVALFAWKKPVTVTAYGHTWAREIKIEVFGPREESAWCGSMPSSAYDVSKSREVRSHNKIPDGEDCSTKRVDNGDGTYKEKRECTTKYREEPVYDDKCRYKIDRWYEGRSIASSGRSLAETPGWAPFALVRTGQCVGCEREGRRIETYRVHFQDQDGGKSECDFDQARWAAIPDGSQWTARAKVLTGALDCSSLAPPGAR
ncbi:MAG: zinc ribbon domain-containing protein [Deltaproteobacteria bacterium]|nr:zinc ribbon domain-containing protein [Deltaproteobacteria bacterium]